VAGFFLAGILSMLRFRASMMSTILPHVAVPGLQWWGAMHGFLVRFEVA
jgi:hypothetical protein